MKEMYFLFIEKNTILNNSNYIKEVRSDPQGLTYTKLYKFYENDSIRIVR